MSRTTSNEAKACLTEVRKYDDSFIIPRDKREDYLNRAFNFADKYSTNGAVAFLPGVIESKRGSSYSYFIVAKKVGNEDRIEIHCIYRERTDISIAVAKDNEHFASYFIQTGNEIACPELIGK